MEDKTHFPQGKYRGVVVSQALSESKNGHPQFLLTFTLEGRYAFDEPDHVEPCEQWERTIWMTITDKTIEYVVKDLARLGFDGDKFGELDPTNTGFHDFAHQVIDVMCEHDTYDGVKRERWRLHREGGGSLDVKPLDAKGVRTLDAMFGKVLKAATKEAKPTTPKRAEKEEPMPVVSDANIPF